MTAKYTFKQFQDEYSNDDACLEAIIQRRYGDLDCCPNCGVASKLHRVKGRRAYACQEGCHIYPCTGTPFEHSSTPLTLWFQAMYLFTATRNGVSAKKLQRQLGVTYKCAWRIGHELRKLMAARDKANNPGQLKGHVEIDETYVGGKVKGKGRRYIGNKAIVMGMIERGGAFKGKTVNDNKKATLFPIVLENVELGTTINTDTLHAYKGLKKAGYRHKTLNHFEHEWARGIHHTNRIEGFWSHLKRGIKSTHASVSRKHLQKYVGEFAFRYNNRHAPADMFKRMLSQIVTLNKTTSS